MLQLEHVTSPLITASRHLDLICLETHMSSGISYCRHIIHLGMAITWD